MKKFLYCEKIFYTVKNFLYCEKIFYTVNITYIMLHLIQKTHLPNFLNKQFIPIFCFFVFAFLLTHKKYSPIYIGFSIFVIFYYSYFIHIAFHKLPDIINLHVNHHHNAEENKIIIEST